MARVLYVFDVSKIKYCLHFFLTEVIKSMVENKVVIEPKVFKEFVAAGSVKSASIKAVERGLIVILRIGSTERVLGQYRGGPRYFQSFDGAAALLQQNGILIWDADTTNWKPRTAQRKQDKDE